MNKEFWKNKNVLVTGGYGLVGSHLTEVLVNLGAYVVIPSRSRDSKSYFMSKGLDKKVVLVDCDLKDRKRVFDAVTKHEIDVIFHIGAQAIVPTAFHNPIETLETNIMGTAYLLEAARYYPKVKAMVVASSDKAYGKSKKLPYVETDRLEGDHPYDASKSCTDLICKMYFNTYGVPVTVSRFGNIYGPGDMNFNRIIPGAIKAGLFDDDLDIRSDGKFIREYVYVKDVVKGYLVLAEQIEKSKGEAFNFGSDEKMNVIEVVDKVGAAMGGSIKYSILNDAKNEIPEQYLSHEKATRVLGWEPSYKLKGALKDTIEWYRDFYFANSINQ
ncbi:GDP-mannose 4,6-dehydratase [Patescibacteria group bacterium]